MTDYDECFVAVLGEGIRGVLYRLPLAGFSYQENLYIVPLESVSLSFKASRAGAQACQGDFHGGIAYHAYNWGVEFFRNFLG